MITYKQLCEQHQKYSDELIARSDLLRRLVAEFCQAISSNLGLNDKYYKESLNAPLADMPYVQLLELESGENQPILFLELNVNFDQERHPFTKAGISLTLEKAANTYPKQRVFIRIEFKLLDNQLNLAFIDFDDNFNITVNLNDDNRFGYAVECYKQAVMRTFEL